MDEKSDFWHNVITANLQLIKKGILCARKLWII
jgi:hypothetical protein